MKKITLNDLRNTPHWQINDVLKQHKCVIVTYYGEPLWLLRFATPEDKQDAVEQKQTKSTE